jgi:mRNA interferase RelE/StbE
MRYTIELTLRASKDLAKLSKTVAKRVTTRLKHIRDSSDPMHFAKPLKGELKGLYRFRIDDYRVIFRKDHKGNITILLVLRIGNRKDVYA